jgi:membrane-associated PAP2 superfamily phosphatase
MTAGKHVLISIIALCLALIWFELTSTDIWMQDILFNRQTNTWLLHKPGWLLHFALYDGIKILLVLVAFALLINLLFFRKHSLIQQYHQGLRIVLFSLILIPATIGALKDTTNIACPKDTVVYGGALPYVKVFESYPAGQQPKEQQRCFPAGHASGGFALMSLYFLFHSERNRRRALLFGIVAGSLMGGYKMLIGDHFLSHTVVTMISAWLLINIIVIADSYISATIKRRFRKPATSELTSS